MTLFNRIAAAWNVLWNGPKVPHTQLKLWKGTDVEFGAYLSSQRASLPVPNDHQKPYAFLYTNADGKVVGLTTRWPGGNRYYSVIQS